MAGISSITQRQSPLSWGESESITSIQTPVKQPRSTPVEHSTSIRKADQPKDNSSNHPFRPKLERPQNKQVLNDNINLMKCLMSCIIAHKENLENGRLSHTEALSNLMRIQKRAREEFLSKNGERVNTDFLSSLNIALRGGALGLTLFSIPLGLYTGGVGAVAFPTYLPAIKNALSFGSAAGTLLEQYIKYRNGKLEKDMSNSQFKREDSTEQTRIIRETLVKDLQLMAVLFQMGHNILTDQQQASLASLK